MPLIAESLRNISHALLVAALVIAGLVLGKDILIPLTFAVMVAFVLSPVVRALMRWGIPHAAAVLVAVSAVTGGLIGVSGVLSNEILVLTSELGQYKANVIAKVRTLTGSATGSGTLAKATAAVESLSTELEKEIKGDGAAPSAPIAPVAGSDAGTSSKSSPSAATPPTVVVAQPAKPSAPSPGMELLGALGGPLAKIALTFLFAIFLLLQYQDLRDRVVRVIGTDHMSDTTSAMSEAGSRLSRLFLMQAVLNASFGAFVGIALWWIGVPNALLWGFVAAIMRFVPYIGSFLAAVPPIFLAAAVDPGWTMFVATLAVFVIGEPLMGHVVEPLVLGKRAGISPFAMVASASFWTLIWGPIGLILAAPLTMTMIVVGRYIEGLEFFSVLLGDEPALTQDQEFYHRLLSDDPISAVDSFERRTEEKNVSAAIDELVLPALSLAAYDHRLGRLDQQQLTNITETVADLKDSLASENDAAPTPRTGKRVLILAARGAVDNAAATFVGDALAGATQLNVVAINEASGLTALGSARAVAGDAPFTNVLIVTVGGADQSQIRFIAKRAIRDFPNAKISVLDGQQNSVKRIISGEPRDVDPVPITRRFDDVLQQLKVLGTAGGDRPARPDGDIATGGEAPVTLIPAVAN